MSAAAQPQAWGKARPTPQAREDDRIRVLHVISTLYSGGTEMAMLRLVRALEPSAYRFRVAYLRGRPEIDQEVEAATGAPPFAVGLRAKADPAALIRLWRYVRAEEIDLVHTHMDLADYYGACAARLGGARALVSTKQNADEFRTRATWKRYPFLVLERIAYQAADRVIVVSQGLKLFLQVAEHLPSRKMVVIGNGVDAGLAAQAPSRAEARRKLGLLAFDPLLGSVGRLAPQKGHLHLLEALPEVLRSFPRAGLALAGEGPARAVIEERARRLGIQDRVVLLGHRREVAEFLAALDLFAFPSLWEGMPQALIEAMAAGLPVVAARCVGVDDVIEHGVEGMLVPPGDPTSLASAIVRILAEPALGDQLGRAAHRRAVDRHSLAAMATQVDRLYRAVLGRSA